MTTARRPPRSMIARIAAILSTFGAGGAHSMTDIARLTGLPISTVHRLTVELASRNLLHRRVDAMFEIGPLLRRLRKEPWSLPALQQYGPPLLDDLCEATGRRARLGVLREGDLLYMEKRPGPDPVTAFSQGATLPAHATAVGKVLLAFGSPASVRHIVRPMTQFTSRTIVSMEHLQRCLSDIRSRKFGIAAGEHFEGELTIAVPVLAPDGAVAAAIEVDVEPSRRNYETCRVALLVGAGALSRELELAESGSPQHLAIVQPLAKNRLRDSIPIPPVDGQLASSI